MKDIVFQNLKKMRGKAIEQILQLKKVPIIVGGTGLYLDSLIYNIEFQNMEYDEEYRNELMQIASTSEGLKFLYDKAKKIDEKAVTNISPNDKKRIIRILEIYKQTGKNKTEHEENSKQEPLYNFKIFVLNWERQELYERINKRVDIMLDNGLVEEVKTIKQKYKKYPTSMQALGYKEVVEYLENRISYDEMVDKIKQETRRYAKRQITWFKKNKDAIWIDAKNRK